MEHRSISQPRSSSTSQGNRLSRLQVDPPHNSVSSELFPETLDTSNRRMEDRSSFERASHRVLRATLRLPAGSSEIHEGYAILLGATSCSSGVTDAATSRINERARGENVRSHYFPRGISTSMTTTRILFSGNLATTEFAVQLAGNC